jgi:hypothetical protein
VAAYTIRVIRNDRDSTELARVTVDTSTNQARVSGSPAVDVDLLLRALTSASPGSGGPSRPAAARVGGPRRRRLSNRRQPLVAIRAPESPGTADRST